MVTYKKHTILVKNVFFRNKYFVTGSSLRVAGLTWQEWLVSNLQIYCLFQIESCFFFSFFATYLSCFQCQLIRVVGSQPAFQHRINVAYPTLKMKQNPTSDFQSCTTFIQCRCPTQKQRWFDMVSALV